METSTQKTSQIDAACIAIVRIGLRIGEGESGWNNEVNKWKTCYAAV